jgi:hypothetical protein
MIDIEIVAKQQGLAKKMASYVDPYDNPFVSVMAGQRPPVNPNTVVEEMSVDKLDNGLLMRIKVNPGGPYKRIYVESIDKLGDALVKALVEARIES